MPTAFFKDIDKFAKAKNTTVMFNSTPQKNGAKRLFFDYEATEKIAFECFKREDFAAMARANKQALVELTEVLNKLNKVSIKGYENMRLGSVFLKEVYPVSNKMKHFDMKTGPDGKPRKLSSVLAYQAGLIDELVAIGHTSDTTSSKKKGEEDGDEDDGEETTAKGRVSQKDKVAFTLRVFDMLRDEILRK